MKGRKDEVSAQRGTAGFGGSPIASGAKSRSVPATHTPTPDVRFPLTHFAVGADSPFRFAWEWTYAVIFCSLNY
jgi:hypothetical protein